MSEDRRDYGTRAFQGTAGPFTNMRVFSGIVTDPVTLTAHIQGWIEARELEGFRVTGRASHVTEGYVVVTVWMGK